MNTTVILENSFEAGCAGRPKPACSRDSFELANAFGSRIYSLAKHITQNDDAAEDVLIETFLEVGLYLDECQEGKGGLASAC